MNYHEIARQFLEQYYSLYNADPVDGQLPRMQLAQVYREQSLFSIQNDEIIGANNIMQKICSENLINHRKRVDNFLTQPSLNNSLLIVVQGTSGFTDQEFQQMFTEIFFVVHENSNFFIVNQFFSLHGV